MISVIINTCCLEGAMYQLSNAKQPHAQRAYALSNFILPQYIADPYIDEVIVVGTFEESPDFTYIPCPSKHFSWEDCLEQRQLGFEASKGDVLIFQHDDHVLEPMIVDSDHSPRGMCLEGSDLIGPFDDQADVLSPSRYTRLRNVNGERLNNGEPTQPTIKLNDTPEAKELLKTVKKAAQGCPKWVESRIEAKAKGYISGHCAIYRREVIEACPWNMVPHVWTMDIEHTKQIRNAGFKIVHTDAIKVWDCEWGSEPWK